MLLGEGAYAFILGIISGYPVGAKIVTKFREDNICTKEECERLLAFTNNSGPLFIIGTVGITMFKDSSIGILLMITHILACISVGIIFRFWKSSNKYVNKNFKRTTYNLNSKNNEITISNLGEILSQSITNAISSIIMIGGFVVLFSVIISILNQSYILDILSKFIQPFFDFFNINKKFAIPTLNGFIELTNGISQITAIPNRAISVNIVLCAFLLGFGGISILLQVYSIISKTDISIKPYILGKFLQGCLAAFYTYLLIHNFSFFNMDLIPVFSNSNTLICYDIFNNYLAIPGIIIVFLFIYFIIKFKTLKKYM